MPDKHTLLGGSKAHRFLECPPSARLEEQFPNESSPYAQEGTQAHSLCENNLRALIGEPLNAIDFEPDEEMVECADTYRDFVEEELNAAKVNTKDAKLFIEQHIDFSDYVPEGFGTADCVICCDDYIEVIDFKYGKGVPVDAEGNPQLRLYALGACIALGDLFEFSRVKTVIYQPRLHSITSELLTIDELFKWAEDFVKPRAALAYEGKGEFKVGEWCRFCKAGGICRARAEEAFAIVDRDKTSPQLLSDEEIPEILDKLDATEKWIEAIRNYAQTKALSGTHWKGYKLVEKNTRRTITDQIGASKKLAEAGFSCEEFTTAKLKGITELEKLVGKVRFNDLLGGLVIKPKGEPTLVKESDKRPEIDPLAEAFKEDM